MLVENRDFFHTPPVFDTTITGSTPYGQNISITTQSDARFLCDSTSSPVILRVLHCKLDYNCDNAGNSCVVFFRIFLQNQSFLSETK